MKTIYTTLFIFFSCLFCNAQVNLSNHLVVCYPFNGNVNDESGNNHNGQPNNISFATDRYGTANSSCSFNGTDSYINLGIYNDLIDSGNNFTFSVWVKANRVKVQTLLMLNPDNNNDRLNASVYYDHNGVCAMFWDYGNIFSGGRCQKIPALEDTTWQHYLFIHNATNNEMQVYKNGILFQQQNTSSLLVSRSRQLHIGGGFDSNITPFFFDGCIDDLRIYDRVLTPDEIQKLFSENHACNETGIVEQIEFSVYPNPSVGGMYIMECNNCTGNEVNCYDVTGRLVLMSEIKTKQTILNLSKLSQGIYELRITGTNKNFTKKLIRL